MSPNEVHAIQLGGGRDRLVATHGWRCGTISSDAAVRGVFTALLRAQASGRPGTAGFPVTTT